MARRKRRTQTTAQPEVTDSVMPVKDISPDGFPHVDGVMRATTRLAGSELGEYLLHPERSAVVVVVTIHPSVEAPFIDASGLAEELSGVAELVVASAEATFGLTDALGDARLSAFYGAGRTYPPGRAWVEDMYAAPLRMCPSPAAARRTSHAIRDDALRVAHASGIFDAPVRRDEDVPCRATVAHVANEQQALVRPDSGGAAFVWAHHLHPDVSASRLFAPGMVLDGWNRGSGHLTEFIPKRPADDAGVRIRAEYGDGDVVLVRVREVSASRAWVELHPEVLAQLTSTTGSDLTNFIRVGDVLAAEIALIDDEWQADFAEGEEPRPATAVMPGGPPWLQPEDVEPAQLLDVESRDELSGAGAAATAPMADHMTDLRSQLDQAKTAVDVYASQVADLELEVSGLQAELKRLRSDLRRASKSAFNLPTVYSDPEDQWRFEMWLAYLQRVPENDRDRFPWKDDFVIGPRFIESVTALEGISRPKVIDVAAETVCGLVRELPGRDLHPWRVGRTGEQEARADGATAWRVALQIRSPGARRLKFWRLRTGGVELDFVGHHDDGIT